MKDPSMLKPAFIGGILLGVLSAIINCGCCIWIIGGGMLAAYFYVRQSPVMVTLGQGVLLGLYAGIVGSVVFALFLIPLLLMSSDSSAKFVEQLTSLMEQMPFYTEDYRKEFMEMTSREGFVAFLYFFTVIAQSFINCILAMLGGTLGVAIFEKRKISGPEQDPSSGKPPSILPPPPPPE